MAVRLTDKILPLNDAFLGMVDAAQVLGGGASGVLPDACMPDLTGDVTTSAGAVATTIGSKKVTVEMLADGTTGQLLTWAKTTNAATVVPVGTAAQVLTSNGPGEVPTFQAPAAGMVYPGAGIALSTGSAWGTSVTNSSANWNTAFGWGNHASAGYLTSVTAHNLLSATHGDTLADTVVRGDVLIGNATPKWARLAFPATPTGKVLQATATDIGWSASALGTAAFTASTAYEASGGIATHAALTATHGVSGAIVGTTDVQALSGKTTIGMSGQLTNTLAIGTAPMVITSTTKVSNLNVDAVDDKHVGTSGNTIPLLDGANTWSGAQLFSAAIELQFRATTNRIYSSAANTLDIEGNTTLNLGKVGDIVLGDGTLRTMRPNTDEKIDLGSTSYRFNQLWLSGDIDIESANIITDTTTGCMFGSGTTQKIGFWGTAPIAKASLQAFTQTYNTPSGTVPVLTSAVVTGTADATYSANEVTLINDLTTAVNDLRTDVTNLAKVITAIIDNLQLVGLAT